MTVEEPTTQGAAFAGPQVTGVWTPDAAAVAEATRGLEDKLHCPNEDTLRHGTKPIRVAWAESSDVIMESKTVILEAP